MSEATGSCARPVALCPWCPLSSFVSAVRRGRGAQEPAAPQPVVAGAAPGRDRQARRSRLRDAHERVAHRPADAGGAGGAGAAAGRRRARRRLRALSRARPADRLQRSAHEGRDARVAWPARTIGCAPSPTASSSTIPIARWCRSSSRRSTRSRASSSGRRSCARWRRSPHRLATSARVPSGAGARGRARRGLLPQRRHRSARRLQGARTRSTRSPPSPSSTVRCRTMRRWRWERSATSARSKRWPRFSGTAPRQTQPSIAAAICLLGVNCASHEGYLIDTLKFADQNVGFQELLRGAAAGLGALAVAGHAEAAEALVADRHPVARSDARAGRARARDGRAAQHAADADAAREPDRSADRAKAIALLAEGFDMLEEDLDKERFFALVRRTYWESPEGSPPPRR